MGKHIPTNHNDITTSFEFDTTYLRLPKKLFTATAPTPVKEPSMVVFNAVLARELGLNVDMLDSPMGAAILGGNLGASGAANRGENGAENGVTTIAQAYAGHQYGHFTMLGDGRAILLGEHLTPIGERLDIQLKGSGPTAYSRRGDGRAALGPMLREYLISEAMHSLGVPSTRSLAVVATGEKVVRETRLPGAVLTRVAKSHLRVGTFQFAAAALEIGELKALADYTIARHYPQCQMAENPYLAFLESVIEAQASLIAKWQGLGFVHGVMNTDNMAISGETIDYGPCAFIDQYDPKAVFSSIDQNGRYAYNNQPTIGAWNLARLAEALLPLIAESLGSRSDDAAVLALANTALQRFIPLFESHYRQLFCQKIGINVPQPGDSALISELLKLMADHRMDFTYTFYALTDYPNNPDNPHLVPLAEWIANWQGRLPAMSDSPFEIMRQVNPAIIPYNHLVEGVLSEATINGNYEPFIKLLALLKEPFSYTDEQRKATEDAANRTQEKAYRTFCGT